MLQAKGRGLPSTEHEGHKFVFHRTCFKLRAKICTVFHRTAKQMPERRFRAVLHSYCIAASQARTRGLKTTDFYNGMKDGAGRMCAFPSA